MIVTYSGQGATKEVLPTFCQHSSCDALALNGISQMIRGAMDGHNDGVLYVMTHHRDEWGAYDTDLPRPYTEGIPGTRC